MHKQGCMVSMYCLGLPQGSVPSVISTFFVHIWVDLVFICGTEYILLGGKKKKTMIETVKQSEITGSISAWIQERKLKGLPGKLRRKPGYGLGFLFFSILLNCTLINCKDEQWHVIDIVELKMNHINLEGKNCAKKDMREYFRTLFFMASHFEKYCYFDFFFQEILVLLENQVFSHSLYTGK